MARPLRIEFAGALYHVTSRGDRREAIYEDDEDRDTFLSTLAEVVERFNWLCHTYCLMTNHTVCEASHKVCYVKIKIMWSGEKNKSYPVDISLIICQDLAYCFT